MSVTVSGDNGLTFNDGSIQQTAASGFGFKNRIINGAMGIWQRGTSSTTTTAGYYTADRWASWIQSGSGTISQDTSSVPSGFQYGLRFTSGGAGSSCNFYHTIETKNCFDLAGQNATLSLYACGTSGVTLTAYILYSTTVDAAFTSGFTSVASLSIPVTTTPTMYSFSGLIPSNAQTIQIYVTPGVASMGSGQYYSITGIQLEKGSTATSFDYRPYGTELALCQRYYQKQLPFRGMGVGTGNTTLARTKGPLIVTMRTSPTIALIGNPPVWDGGGVYSLSALQTTYTTPDLIEFDGTLATNSVVGRAMSLYSDAAGNANLPSTTGIQASAEL